MNFSYYVILASMGLSCNLKVYFASTCHVENTGSFSCAYLPNADILHYTIPKIISVNISTALIRRVFKDWKSVKPHGEGCTFSKIPIFS